MPWTHRTIIVPGAVVIPARLACEALAGAGGSGMYSVPLSPSGDLPATHWISSGLIEQEFADLLAGPDALAAVGGSAAVIVQLVASPAFAAWGTKLPVSVSSPHSIVAQYPSRLGLDWLPATVKLLRPISTFLKIRSTVER